MSLQWHNQKDTEGSLKSTKESEQISYSKLRCFRGEGFEVYFSGGEGKGIGAR